MGRPGAGAGAGAAGGAARGGAELAISILEISEPRKGQYSISRDGASFRKEDLMILRMKCGGCGGVDGLWLFILIMVVNELCLGI